VKELDKFKFVGIVGYTGIEFARGYRKT